jgi:hypothetical protein
MNNDFNINSKTNNCTLVNAFNCILLLTNVFTFCDNNNNNNNTNNNNNNNGGGGSGSSSSSSSSSRSSNIVCRVLGLVTSSGLTKQSKSLSKFLLGFVSHMANVS